MFFASDNWAGASDKVLDAIVTAGRAGPMAAYGDDAITAGLEARFAEIFEREVAVFLVATGTAANALSIAAFAPPWGAVVVHEEGHLAIDECGAPEFFAGTRTIRVPGRRGRLDPDDLARRLAALPRGLHHGALSVLSITLPNEYGRLYTPAEVTALGDVARAHGLALHMDGARLPNALARLGCTPAELTWKAGVDVLSFGGTKDGCLMAEAVVCFDLSRRDTLAFLRKRSGQLVSKHRLIAAQFEAWLDDGHWLALATHANAMAERLAAGLATHAEARLPWQPEANEIFVYMTPATAESLNARGARFYDWSTATLDEADGPRRGERLYRLVTSFATSPEEVDAFLAALDVA